MSTRAHRGQAARDPTREVTEYFDANTARFLRWGEGGSQGAIHRALWAPGIDTLDAAIDHVNVLVARALRPGAGEGGHVVDLGCGVGGTALRLRELLDVDVTGITLSGVQVELARARARQRGAAERCRFVHGDFLEPPPMLRAQGAVAIESLVVGRDVGRFFEVVASLLEPGGRLVVVDDVVVPGVQADRRAARALERFVRGWRLSSLTTVQRLTEAAEGTGLVLEEDVDLTAWIRLGRPRDRAIAALVAGLGWCRPLERWPAWSNCVGGDALQRCLRQGWVQYRLLVFSRRAVREVEHNDVAE